MDERKFVGKSLSLCVLDILKGNMNPDDVLFINAGTMIRSIDDMLSVCHNYIDYGPWTGYDMDDVLPVVEDLIFNNKLYQARLYNEGWHLPRSLKLHRQTDVVFEDIWMDVTNMVDSLLMDDPRLDHMASA